MAREHEGSATLIIFSLLINVSSVILLVLIIYTLDRYPIIEIGIYDCSLKHHYAVLIGNKYHFIYIHDLINSI